MGAKLIRFFLTAFFCVVACSCVTRRTITHTKQENATEAKINASADSSTIEMFWNTDFLHVVDSSKIEQFVDVVIYDTHTVDYTGAHPVKATAHITTIAKNATVIEKRDTSAVEIVKHYSDTLSITSRDTMSVVLERESKTDAKPFNMSFFCLILIFLFVFMAIYTYKLKK